MKLKNDEWNYHVHNEIDTLSTEEEKKCSTVMHSTSNSIGSIIEIKQYSEIQRLLRVTSRVIRFVNNLKLKVANKIPKVSPILSPNKLNYAEELWINDNQNTLNMLPRYKQIERTSTSIKTTKIL